MVNKNNPKNKVKGKVWVPGYFAQVEFCENEVFSKDKLTRLHNIKADQDTIEQLQEDYVMFYVANIGYYITRKKRKTILERLFNFENGHSRRH